MKDRIDRARRSRRVLGSMGVLLVVAALGLALVGIEGLRARSSAAPATVVDPMADGARRILFVGDSLTFGARDQLVATFAAHDVEAHFVGYPGTGLLSNKAFWLRSISDQVRTWQPDVVVIEACCNYANGEPGYIGADGRPIAADTPAMFSAWADHAREAVRRASARGAKVRWVVTPQAGPRVPAEVRARIERFESIYAGLGVARVDWRGALQPDGHFTRTVAIDGRRVQVRKHDDLHMDAAGSRLVAAATWRAVADDLGLPALARISAGTRRRPGQPGAASSPVGPVKCGARFSVCEARPSRASGPPKP